MSNRKLLQQKLESILGSSNVYFQPPESTKMNYPAIVYHLNQIENRHAGNIVYKQSDSYSVTMIDTNPDNTTVRKLAGLPLCRFNNHYRADNLNHWNYTLYY